MLFHFCGAVATVNLFLGIFAWYTQRFAGSVLTALKQHSTMQLHLVCFVVFAIIAIYADYRDREDAWDEAHP